MANKSSVYVEPQESGWAVVGEGSERATSVHPTQGEAVKEGRDIARRDKTKFFLYTLDGRIREHNSYGEEPPLAKEEGASQTAGLVDAVTETVGEVLRRASGAVGALGDATRGSETTSEESDDTEEALNLAGEQHDDRSPEERYAGYEIYDQDGERIGKLNDVFVDEDDNLEYVGVGTGLSDTGSVLIPVGVVTVDVGLKRMMVSRSKSAVEAGPAYRAHEEVTPEFEERVRGHYGLASGRGADDKGDYGAYYRDEERAETGHTGSSAVGSAT